MTNELTNEQAINELKAMKEHIEPYMSIVGTTAYDMGIQTLESQQEWIPCGERLPEECKEVLITYHIPTSRYRVGIDSVQSGYWLNHSYVEAWMPLPQPYKAESEDKE